MSQFSVEFAYQWVAIVDSPLARVYFSPTLRLLECRKTVILDALQNNNTVDAELHHKIRSQLIQIVQGGVVLVAQHEEAAPLRDFLAQLFSDLNTAGIVLPPDLPGSEFKKWFPGFKFTPEQKKTLTTTVHRVVLPRYTPLKIERCVSLLGHIAFFATLLLGSIAVAASFTNPLVAAFCFILTAAGLAARTSDLNRWNRLGRYLQRVWAGIYYDKRTVLWHKGCKRLLIGLGVLVPMGILVAHKFTLKGILEGLFLLGEQLGLMSLLQHTVGQMLAFALFLIIVTGRVLKPLEYGLKNTVGPALLSKLLSCVIGDSKAWNKIFKKACIAYDCKRTTPAQEIKGYQTVEFCGMAVVEAQQCQRLR